LASGAVYDAIRLYLDGGPDSPGTGAWQTTPIRWENEPLDPLPDVFVDVEMTGTMYDQMSLGANQQKDNRWDEEGTIWLHVLVPDNSGGSVARTYCKSLADLFRGLTLLSGSLEFKEAFIGRGQAGFEDGNYFRITTYCNWRRMDA
jgi:hypothetical protein